MPDETLLEVRRYDGPGFKPLIFFNAWRVALMNYTESLEPENIRSVERHPQTDEVFVLTRGQATLFLGEGETQVERLYAQPMEPGVIYNVKPQTWHTIVMSDDASVLIVENADTGEHNSQFCELRPEQRRFIMEEAVER
jgi:ureidoglycolate hydrolase